MTQISILPIILLKFYSILSNPARSAINCDNYDGGNVRLSSITMFQFFKLQNLKKEIYIRSKTSKRHKKEITNDEHKINNM